MELQLWKLTLTQNIKKWLNNKFNRNTVTITDKYQLPKLHKFWEIAGQNFKDQGHSKVKGHTMTLHIYTFQPMSLPSINFLHFMDSEI